MPSWLVRDAASGALEVMPQQQPDGLPLSVIWPRRKLLPKVDALLAALDGLQIR